MRDETLKIHGLLEEIGAKLGFRASVEVRDSVLSLELDQAYNPQVDLMWSLGLSKPQSDAIARVLGRDAAKLAHLPVVGIEVEGTSPTTKTMASDVANIAALGTRIGLLVVSEAGEKNIYRRAARAVRTLRRSFGDLNVVPVEASWLPALRRKRWSRSPGRLLPQPARAPAGGETKAWGKAARTYLRALGQGAGFVVAEPYIPVAPSMAFMEQLRLRGELTHMVDPCNHTIRKMTKAADYLTACQIDLAWLLPLPAALQEFLEEVSRLDPCLREHGLLHPALHESLAVVGFELESDSGKHAGGGLLNLSAHCVAGVAVTPTERGAAELGATLRRYQPTLGLRNVRVRSSIEIAQPGQIVTNAVFK